MPRAIFGPAGSETYVPVNVAFNFPGGLLVYAPDDDDNAIRLIDYRNGQLQKTITPAQSGGLIGVTTTY